MLFGLCVIALAVMFGGSAVGLGSTFVVFSCFIVFVSSHRIPPAGVEWNLRKTERNDIWFQQHTGAMQAA
jgi:high-affinity Fe2+/Pb2+ permease